MGTIKSISDQVAKAQDTILRRLFLDRQAAFWRDELAPRQLMQLRKACITSIVEETADTKTFVMRPGRTYAGHEAGQFITVEVEVEGVRLRRAYSISSAPGGEEIAITVKRVAEGRVSNWLHDHAHPGMLLDIGAVSGEFRLPTPRPAGSRKLLFLSAGSGITPVMSMLRELAATRALEHGSGSAGERAGGPSGEPGMPQTLDPASETGIQEVVFVHYARSRADVIFGQELEQLAERYPGLRLVLCLDDEAQAGGGGNATDTNPPRGFDEARFAALVPDFAERDTYLCGPAPVMERVSALYAERGVSAQLRQEAFVSAPLRRPTKLGEPARVTLERSGREVLARGPGTLLEQLERAGETPASGCRIGICHTCRCTKKSGTVQNLVTGEISSDADQEIQLCISAARSDLELSL